jgi:exodeoxyribonuclease V alpha subunit
MTTLEGHLERITYYNPENHYTVAQLKTGITNRIVTVVGSMAAVRPGQTLRIQGSWVTHSTYGRQFKIETYEVALPSTIDGIREYLESGIIKGIGPLMAKRMTNRFGEKTFAIIENNPNKLLEVKGIGRKKAVLIFNAWEDHHVARGLMQFFQKMGMKTSYCARILRKFGKEAVNIISSDPYRLSTDIPGIGFNFADTVALKLGMAKNEPGRVKACIIHLMKQHANEGHVFFYEDQLLDQCQNRFQIKDERVRHALEALSAEREIVIGHRVSETGARTVYLKSLHMAETGIANRLKAMLSLPVIPHHIDTQHISAEVQRKLAIRLSPEQVKVLGKIFSHRVVIITGGPGTGKTTLIKSINALFSALGKGVLLAAPTGRAARRLAEVTQKEAKTIHRLLGYNFKNDLFEKNQDNPLDADAVIVDEASMVDTLLMFHLLRAVPVTAMLILVGDVFQLPSVGPGNVLSDMIKSDRTLVFYLKTIFRQTQESPIVINAHRVRNGDFPVFEPWSELENLSEFYFIEQQDPHKVVSGIVELCSKVIPKRFGFDPVHEVQVLTPMHKGLVGTANLNQVLQKTLNPNPIELETNGVIFKQGDKVMHLKNNYQKEVFNGDIGIIRTIDRKEEVVAVDYYGRIVTYDFAEMNELSVAYATTVHKSQGSEYPAVILPIMTQHYMLLQRNLLYTAITRAKKLAILTGTKKALSIALRNNKPKERLSGLDFRLSPNFS